MLHQIINNYSPYLSKLSQRHPALFEQALEGEYEAVKQQILDELEAFDPQASEQNLRKFLRDSKEKLALLTAVADLKQDWQWEKVTQSLSVFADLAIQKTLAFLLDQAKRNNVISIKLDSQNILDHSGVIVIAMGKWGGYELNYSSDIDLIVFFDGQAIDYHGRLSVPQFYIEITQKMVNIIEERTADGYVFRCDLRLRPDPGSTRIAISIEAAERYYETLGQNWERAAMIKSRVVAGDIDLAHKFQTFIGHFVWRKYLDFASVEDIHSIKRQIDSKHGKMADNFYDYNVKLGKGGIREIEFFAQTQQLIWGGKHPRLQKRETCETLKVLHKMNRISNRALRELTEAYGFLRHVEHRLQMLQDQQTHNLPCNEEAMEKFAVFAGYECAKDFLKTLAGQLSNVQYHYSLLFETSPSLASNHPHVSGNLVFTGTEDDPETLDTLRNMGFANASMISEVIRGWHYGRYRSTRTKKSREQLTELMPNILHALSQTAYPDTAFKHFDQFLTQVPSGLQIFSLFYNNPNLLDLLAEIMGGYPYLADLLTRMPAVLEYVLSPEFHNMLPDKLSMEKNLKQLLKTARDLEDVVLLTRRWCHDRQFRIGVQMVQQRIDSQIAGKQMANIAQVTLNAIFNAVFEEFCEEYGEVEGGAFAITALGKMGSFEMTFRSDLDLIFVYDAAGQITSNSEEKPLAVAEYYARLSRRFINAVTAMTREGRLYDVDMRLRPSGEGGPIASSIEAFIDYYKDAAWAWEFMALIRGRVVVSSRPELADKLQEGIRGILAAEHSEKRLLGGIAEMHTRLEREKYTDNSFNVKRMRGGAVTLEFVVHSLCLLHAHKYSSLLVSHTASLIQELGHNHIIPEEEIKQLLDALVFYHEFLAITRLLGGDNPRKEELTPGMQNILCNHMKCDTIDVLEAKLLDSYDKVYHLFEKYILIPSVGEEEWPI